MLLDIIFLNRLLPFREFYHHGLSVSQFTTDKFRYFFKLQSIPLLIHELPEFLNKSVKWYIPNPA
jgi:hypothetical protein